MRKTNVLERILAILLAAGLLFICSGCSASGNGLFRTSGKDAVKWAKNFDSKAPDSLTVSIEHENSSENPQIITDKATINAVYEAMSNIEITKSVTRSDSFNNTIIYTFEDGDGSTVSFSFQDGRAMIDGSLYKCSGVNELFAVKGIDLSVVKGAAQNSGNPSNAVKSKASGGQSNGEQSSAEPASGIQLVAYDGGFFSVNLPKGWTIETVGEYASFGFRAWDPQNPDYQIFYYGKFEPFLKSQEAKNWYQDTSASLGAGNMYQIFADAPALYPATASTLFRIFNEFAAYANMYGVNHNFTCFQNMNIIQEIPYSTYFSQYATDEGMVLASFQSEQGTGCIGRFGASVVSMGSYPISTTIDTSPLAVYNISGVMAPQDQFDAVSDILSQAVFSLNFSQEYADEAKRAAEDSTADALAANAVLQAVYDAYNEAWDEYIRG